MHISAISPDLIALAVVAASVFYGVLRGAPGVRITMLAGAAGYVATTQLSSWIPNESRLPSGVMRAGIIAAIVLAFALTQHRPVRHGSVVVGAIGGAVSGIFNLLMVFLVIPGKSQSWLTGNSLIFSELHAFQNTIIAGAIAVGVLIPLLYHRQIRSRH